MYNFGLLSIACYDWYNSEHIHVVLVFLNSYYTVLHHSKKKDSYLPCVAMAHSPQVRSGRKNDQLQGSHCMWIQWDKHADSGATTYFYA